MIPKLPYDAHATQSLFVLGLLVCEVLPCPAERVSLALFGLELCNMRFKATGYVRRKFSQLVTDHVLRYCDIIVFLAIVDLELQTHEVWEDSRGARLCLDGRLSFAGLRSRNGEALYV